MDLDEEISNKIYICSFIDNIHRMRISYVNPVTAIITFYNTRYPSNAIRKINGNNITCSDITNSTYVAANIANQFVVSPMSVYRFICGNHAIVVNSRGYNNIILSSDLSNIEENIRRLDIR